MAGTPFTTESWQNAEVVTLVNPASALASPTLCINLEDLPAEFWANVQSDGGDIRVTDGSFMELAFDFELDTVHKTGWIKCMWPGTLASTGTQLLLIWSSYTEGTAIGYGVDEVYGRNNTYNSIAEFPQGGGTDHTGNGYDTTAYGCVEVGGVDGVVGKATDYDGNDDYCYTQSQLPKPYTIIALVKFDDVADDCTILNTRVDNTFEFSFRTRTAGKLNLLTSGGAVVSTLTVSTGTWHLIGVTWDATNTVFYLDNTSDSRTSLAYADISVGTTLIGNLAGSNTSAFNGRLSHLQCFSNTLTPDEVDYLHTMYLDGGIVASVEHIETTTGGGDYVAVIAATISNKTQLLNFVAAVNAGDIQPSEIRLLADILELGEIEPIGSLDIPFTAKFRGNGHVIDGLTITGSTAAHVGLFGVIDGGAVDKLRLTNINISGAKTDIPYLGMLAGACNGNISQCEVAGYVTSLGTNSIVGGLVGYFNNYTNGAKISNCKVAGTIDRGSYVGGVCGDAGESSFDHVFVDIEVLNAEYGYGTLAGQASLNPTYACESYYNAVTMSAPVYDWGVGLSIEEMAYLSNYVGFSPIVWTIADGVAALKFSSGHKSLRGRNRSRRRW